MGYYTDYDCSANRKEIIDAIDDQMDYYGSGGTGEVQELKWYSCIQDLEKVSLKFPGELIVVEGVGEEYPDIWKAFVKDGLSYTEKAQILMPEYDPSRILVK